MSESKRMMLHESRIDPELAALLERARAHQMTPDEIATQRRSWVIGEMMLEYPDLTKETAADMYEKMLRDLGNRPTPPTKGTTP